MSEEQEKATPEQIKAYRENMKKFYEDQIPYLKKVKEYETLLADIEEQRAKRTDMMLRIAHMTTPQATEPTMTEEEKEEFEVYRASVAEKYGKQGPVSASGARPLKKVSDDKE